MQIQKDNIILIIAVITGIFLMAALFMFFYISIFIERKKRHKEEKERMNQLFGNELIRTEVEVQEQTRKNLASDLHDNIGQLLSLTSMILGSLNIKDAEKAEQKISEAQGLVIRSIKELRQLSKLIHGEQLIQQGLTEAIRQEINWLERNGHYSIAFHGPEGTAPFEDAEKNLFMYRLFQESLNNIIKHAEADKITVELKYIENRVALSIGDNGIGFGPRDAAAEGQGLGLKNMQRRVAMLNGAMNIQSEPGRGTLIYFSIPYA
ncbi:MAG TPA: sensor histidine kinase [Puia sp.]|nr:sensor histidine kinase [Puia sp.]